MAVKIVQYLASSMYKPLLVKYLSVTRSYVYRGIRLLVPSGVFHPGFFFSTKLLLQHLDRQPLEGKSFLELGAGSGLISLYIAQKKGARVTATDINPMAIRFLETNRERNDATMTVIQSDLFRDIPYQLFDVIAVNPPYYRKEPVNDAERAWYCGENGEYFNGFFGGLDQYTHSRSDIWMILCDGCDLEMIRGMAARYGWFLRCCLTTRNWVEKNFIFRIERADPGIL